MHKALLLGFALFFSFNCSLYGQKVKYKKGAIYVNKEHKYNFEKEKNEEPERYLDSYFLKDLEGNLVFSMTDTAFYLKTLPHEISPRVGFEGYVCKAPRENLSGLIASKGTMSYRKQRIKDLSKVGFFETGNFSQDILQKFIDKQYPTLLEKELEEYAALNDVRAKNAELTTETFGELLERKPIALQVVINVNKHGNYVIKEGGKLLANINLIEKGDSNHSYRLVNHDGIETGLINIFQNPESGVKKYNIRLDVRGKDNAPENFEWFLERISSLGPKTSVASKLTKIATYLVENAYM